MKHTLTTAQNSKQIAISNLQSTISRDNTLFFCLGKREWVIWTWKRPKFQSFLKWTHRFINYEMQFSVMLNHLEWSCLPRRFKCSAMENTYVHGVESNEITKPTCFEIHPKNTHDRNKSAINFHINKLMMVTNKRKHKRSQHLFLSDSCNIFVCTYNRFIRIFLFSVEYSRFIYSELNQISVVNFQKKTRLISISADSILGL